MQGSETFKKQTTYPLEMHLSVKTTLKTKAMIKTKQKRMKIVPTEESGDIFLTSNIVFFYT